MSITLAQCPLLPNQCFTVPPVFQHIIHIRPVAFTDGLGDIKMGVEFYNIIKDYFFRGSTKLVTHAVLRDSYRIFLKPNFPDFVEMNPNDTLPFADLTIHYPMVHDNAMNELTYFFTTRMQHLLLNEYGFSSRAVRGNKIIQSLKMKAKWLALGAGKNDLGVLFSETLHRAFLENFSPATGFKRFFPELPQTVKRAILERSSMKEFMSDSLLYMGYSYSGEAKSLFVRAIVRLNAKGTKNLCLVLVGKDLPDLDDLSRDIKLKKEGVARIDYLTASNAKSEPVLVKTTQIAKKGDHNFNVRIIFFTSMNASDMIYLRKASQKEVLCTGNHSFLETLSFGQYPIYEMRSHILQFGVDLAETSTNPNFAKHLFLSFILEEHRLGSEVVRASFSNQDVDKAVAMMRQLRQNDRDWRVLTETLYHSHNLIPKLIAIIREFLGPLN